MIGPSRPGRKAVILGDTCDSSQIAPIAHNCDVLIHESTFESQMKRKALKYMHSTSCMAGEFAKQVNRIDVSKIMIMVLEMCDCLLYFEFDILANV